MKSSDSSRLRETFRNGVTLANRYVLANELGRGGMGVVFLAHDQRLQREVAVKAILPSELSQATMSDRVRILFEQEAQLGAKLMHPAIATVFDYGLHDGLPFAVFEYVPGQTLQHVLKTRKRFSVEETLAIVPSLSLALDIAHANHIVHRDLKPANIRVTEQGQFKILDLGLAKRFNEEQDWSFSGTPAYASPEQCAELPSDGRTDQYALALIVYEMLTGERVFRASEVLAVIDMHKTKAPLDPRELAPEIPNDTAVAILRALAKDPQDRFSDCQRFACALGAKFTSEGDVGTSFDLSSAVCVDIQSHNLFLPPLRLASGGGFAAIVGPYIWIARAHDVLRLPLAAVRDVEWSSYSAQRVRFATDIFGEKAKSQSIWVRLTFTTPEEREAWTEKLDEAVEQSESSSNAGKSVDAVREQVYQTVAMLRHMPTERAQLLGVVNAVANNNQTAKSEMMLRASVKGGDGVANVEVEKLPSSGEARWHASGDAIKSIGRESRDHLVSRWFGQYTRQACISMIGLSLVSFVMWCLSTILGSTASGVKGAAFAVSIATLYHSWLLISASMLIRLRWPQLVMPTAIAALALGAMGVAGLAGRFAHAVSDGEAFKFAITGRSDLLVSLGFLTASALIFNGFRRAKGRFDSVARTDAVVKSRARAAVVAFSWIGSITLVLAVLALAAIPLFADRDNSLESGIQSLRRANYRQAIEHFDETIKNQPKNALAVCFRGMANRLKRNLEEARKDLDLAIQMDPSLGIAFRERGRLNIESSSFEAAHRDLTRAISLDRNDKESYFFRGNVLFALKDADGAIANYTHAISVDSDFAAAYYNRGLCFAKKGLASKAEADFRKAKSLGVRP